MIGYNEEYASTLVEILCAENHYITGEEGDELADELDVLGLVESEFCGSEKYPYMIYRVTEEGKKYLKKYDVLVPIGEKRHEDIY